MWRDNSLQARVTRTHWSTKWNAINGRSTIQLFLALSNVVTSTVVAGMVANWENYTSQRQNQTMYSSRTELISVTCTVMGKNATLEPPQPSCDFIVEYRYGIHHLRNAIAHIFLSTFVQNTGQTEQFRANTYQLSSLKTSGTNQQIFKIASHTACQFQVTTQI